MKKLGILVVLAILLGLALPVSNLVVGTPTGTALTAQATGEFAKVAPLLEAKCLNCHSSEAKLPFYADFPIARDMIQEDMDDGTAYLDMLAAYLPAGGKPVNEAVLAKTEQTLIKDTMPPAKYLALHWDAVVGDDDRKALMDWIHGVRVKEYSPKGLPGDLARAMVHPLPDKGEADTAKVALGDKLFHDKRLSKDDTISCASCHGLDKGGTDQAQFSTGVGGALGDINSPTVYNAVFAIKQFWDGRAADLQEQADGPVNNPIEMASNWAQVTEKLLLDEAFTAAFLAAYPDGYSKKNFTDAIARFEATLVTPDSAFDRFLKGDEAAMGEDAKKGWHLFQDHDCVTCHVGKGLGNASFERMGREEPYFADKAEVGKADYGLFNFTENEKDRFFFKVPTLRNIALTHPYFHDGTAKDLAAAVKVMSDVQVVPTLTDGEVAQVVAFLKALTGKYQGKLLSQTSAQ